MTAEYAPGQFEINLQHLADPMLAADHCVMFKRAVKGVARRHGVQADYLGPEYPRLYAACKTEELEAFERHIGAREYAWDLQPE